MEPSIPHATFAAVIAAGALTTSEAAAEIQRPSGTRVALQGHPDSSFEEPRGTLRPAVKDKAPSKPRSMNEQESQRVLGATLDMGVPDGVMAGVVARPWTWMRFSVGAGSNFVSPGIRGGIALIPFGVGPSLSIEGGHYFDGDGNGTISAFAGSGYDSNLTAKKFGYQFVNAHLGLELGRDAFTFFVHGGMSYLHTKLHNANDTLGSQTGNEQLGFTTITIGGDPVVTAWFPSIKFGFILYVV